MGNERSRVFWWDLQRLEEGPAEGEGGFKVPGKKGRRDGPGGAGAGGGLLGLGVGGGSRPGLGREESIASSVSHASSAAVSSVAASAASAASSVSADSGQAVVAAAAASAGNLAAAPASASAAAPATGSGDPAREKEREREREKEKEKEVAAKEGRVVKASVGVGDPFHPIPAHKSAVVGKVTFATRQISWSRGGEWAVAVGDQGMVCLFRRLEDGVGSTS